MPRTLQAVTHLVLISVLALTAIAQKGKPSACPVPPPLPASDTKCFLGTSGCLDTSFGANGFVLFPRPSAFTGVSIEQMAVQPWDAKIVAVGSFNSPDTTVNAGLVIRFNYDGSLDTTFGDVDSTNPLVRRGYLIDGYLNRSVAVQPDGYIVTGGNQPNFGGWSIRRYTPDGQKDTAFGAGGAVIPGIGTSTTGLAIQADGKILAAGSGQFLVMRLLQNGTPDPTFSSDGIVNVNPSATSFGSGSARSIALQKFSVGSGIEERIVLGGYASNAATKREQGTAVDKFALMRFLPDGSVDSSFDGDGRVMTDFFGRQSLIFRIVVDANNRIVATGQVHATGCPDSPDAGFARYNSNGSLDASFSGDGKANIDLYGYQNYTRDLALQTFTDGETVTQKIVGFGHTDDANSDYAVIRLNADGSLDNTFGLPLSAGWVTYSVGSNTYFGYGTVQPDNRIIIGGKIDDYAGFIRYLP